MKIRYPKLKLLVLLCTLLLVLGCSKNSSSNELGNPGGVEGAFSSAAIWVSDCFDSDRFGLTMISRFEIEGEAFRRINEYHSDGNCSELAVTSVEEGAMVRTPAASGEPSGAIDFTYSNIEITPIEQPGILALNAVSYCGSNAWQLNVTKDVTRSSGGSACWDRTPRTLKDIYLVDGHTLIFGVGTEKEKGDSASRPTALDQTRRWRIQ